MVLKAYAVFDVKAGNYSPPWFLLSDGIAHRTFSDLVNDPKTTIARHPGDYSLFAVGSYDDDSAQFTSQKPVQIVQAISLYVDPNVNQLRLPGVPLSPANQAIADADDRKIKANKKNSPITQSQEVQEIRSKMMDQVNGIDS